MQLARELVEYLIYGADATHRYTQDSPVLADVWIAYGIQPGEAQDLLLTPRFGATAGKVSVHLRTRLTQQRAAPARGWLRSLGGQPDKPGVAYNQVYVVGRTYYDELLRVVLPLTTWWDWLWKETYQAAYGREPDSAEGLAPSRLLRNRRIRPFLVTALRAMQTAMGRPSRPGRAATASAEVHKAIAHLPADLPWFVHVAGVIGSVQPGYSAGWQPPAPDGDGPPVVDKMRHLPTPGAIIDTLARLLAGHELEEHDGEDARVWLVNLNRDAHTAVSRSRLAIKADAAQRLFDIDTKDITWAIIDSGIDASHPAFLRQPTRKEREKLLEDVSKNREAVDKNAKDADRELARMDDADAVRELMQRQWKDFTRVKGTYDFTRVRYLLDPDEIEPGDLPEWARSTDRRHFAELKKSLLAGRAIDWSLLEPLLRVPHDLPKRKEALGYVRPQDGHGTHVAGILAADWPSGDVVGICPTIRLYDMRVLDPDGSNDEFAVLAALQFTRWLNSQKDYYAVHGVNLSLSIRHEVANFACGRTPVCDQCEELVGSGVVVVAAAGNSGYLKYVTVQGPGKQAVATEGYHTVSITDPGNADAVITVGSTHRFQPHTYGVSYFSSRGPTGDGRIKPDLVAPGEKIQSAYLQGNSRKLDGTSMAAPHVSGAAAMLMARHSELVGDPARIKRILCDTATDLGREPYFQGAGMLDVLRALQSI